MYKITLAILLACLVVGLFSNTVWAEENFMLTISSLAEFEEGTHSIVYGKTMTLDERPVSQVTIHVYFPSAIIKTTTNSTGQFSVKSPVPVEIGEHNITVYAKKDNKYTNASITYQVIEAKPKQLQETQKPANTNGEIKLDPFSEMIKQLEEQKTQEVNRQINTKEQSNIDEQRLVSQKYLENDLREFEKKNESHNPRNAFYKFIQEIDASVRGIFWQQFLFTERITQQASDAKELALKEGKSSYEATKIFQKKAAVTQQEVIEFNKNLNIGYGNATSDIQNLFDKEGKLPREN